MKPSRPFLVLVLAAVFAGLMLAKVSAQAVAEEIHADTYERRLYRHWVDLDGDGLDTRQEVLKAESLIDTLIVAGKIRSGLWVCKYTGAIIRRPHTMDADHIVPLKEAHRSGAHAWGAERRKAFANDMENLIAVCAGPNRSKGDKDPASWMPPNRAYWCAYLARWVAVKVKWGLALDPEEYRAVRAGNAVCARFKNADSLGDFSND